MQLALTCYHEKTIPNFLSWNAELIIWSLLGVLIWGLALTFGWLPLSGVIQFVGLFVAFASIAEFRTEPYYGRSGNINLYQTFIWVGRMGFLFAGYYLLRWLVF